MEWWIYEKNWPMTASKIFTPFFPVRTNLLWAQNSWNQQKKIMRLLASMSNFFHSLALFFIFRSGSSNSNSEKSHVMDSTINLSIIKHANLLFIIWIYREEWFFFPHCRLSFFTIFLCSFGQFFYFYMTSTTASYLLTHIKCDIIGMFTWCQASWCMWTAIVDESDLEWVFWMHFGCRVL